MRTPLPLLDQIARLRLYMRTLRADLNRTYRDDSISYRKRKISPFVESLRYRRFRQASELLDVAEECMNQLRQAGALTMAEFFPGDQITMEVVMKGYERPPERFIVYNVEWSKSGGYRYVAWQVTKQGQLFKRGTSWLCPSSRIQIRRCDDPLPEDTQRQSAYFRERAQEFMNNALERGKIEEIVKTVCERRERRGY